MGTFASDLQLAGAALFAVVGLSSTATAAPARR